MCLESTQTIAVRVRYSLGRSSSPMAVAPYTYDKLPPAEQEILPNEGHLVAALEWAEPDSEVIKGDEQALADPITSKSELAGPTLELNFPGTTLRWTIRGPRKRDVHAAGGEVRSGAAGSCGHAGWYRWASGSRPSLMSLTKESLIGLHDPAWPTPFKTWSLANSMCR